jgi:hypothetical protein
VLHFITANGARRCSGRDREGILAWRESIRGGRMPEVTRGGGAERRAGEGPGKWPLARRTVLGLSDRFQTSGGAGGQEKNYFSYL